MVGCDGSTPTKHDAAVAVDDSLCNVRCFDDGTDAGVCPDPFVCVSANRECPAGCSCSAYCYPDNAQGEVNCPVGPTGPQCAFPDRTCPDDCTPVG